MIVVSDTSALCYLILIGEIEILPQLFGQILIPRAVAQELNAEGAPMTLIHWIVQPPDWLEIRLVTSVADSRLLELHQGEREAILLAEEIGADLVILDEKAARNVAKERGLNLTGLLGILEMATIQKLIDLPTVVERLQNTSFRASPSFLKSLLDRHSS
ncbi:MAG: DUF3368 domain-containing protein [Hydrococcus sp. RU_2_2]|nr:DUF3368 domain-containing protein [Hydrococcus sp. RU_2_2]NJP21054.1 DUF3368 domain-containing protein [Hydrococcus sp. CRU_1_1]NJQ96575.1 DUF3368 domain-containing protein [Hydrococcus sp. CSU_1_8]